MNNKIKLINTGKCNILAMMVPEGAKAWINPYIKEYLHVGHIHGDAHSLPLPEGNWQILGISTELTEEEWTNLLPIEVTNIQGFICGDYIDYLDRNNYYETAKESGLSLLEANQCFSVNPYGKEAPIVSDPDPHSQYYGAQMDELYRWQQAQENTGKWLILNKL